MVKVIRITKKEFKLPGMKEREREAMSYLETVVDMRPPLNMSRNGFYLFMKKQINSTQAINSIHNFENISFLY